MKVIHLVSNKVWGGGERYALDLCAALRADGIDTVAVTRGSDVVDSKFAEANIPIEKAPFRGFLDFSTPGAVARVARQWPVGERIIIHAHNFKDGLLAVKAARKLRRSGYDAKTVITRHLVKKAATDRLNTDVYRRLDALVMISGLVKDRFLESDPDIDHSKIHLIPNSIALLPLDKKEEEAPRRTPVILFVGRLAEEKGLGLLLEALVPIKDLVWKMVIAGAGTPEMESELRDTARRLGIGGRIQWTGHVSDIWPLMEKADIGVVPSTWEEPFGLCILEFLRAGVPVVSTDRGAQREIITDGADGILTHTDPASFSKGLRRLLEDPALRRQMGRHAMATFERFSYPTFYKRMLEVYESC